MPRIDDFGHELLQEVSSSGRIQARDGFIEDEQIRFMGQRANDRQALLLTAGQAGDARLPVDAPARQ
jgi:hypothetical protein